MEPSQPSPSSCFHSVLQLSSLTAATIPHSRELAGPNSVVSVLDHASSSSIESWSMTTDTEHETAAAQSSVIRLRGCPFNCDADAIRAFFQPTELSEVYFCRRDGRATGEAYVVLAPAANPQAVLSHLDKKYIGNRYIELFEASAADLCAVKKMLEDRSQQGYVVRLRGLPYTATEADVRGFMDGVQLSDNPDCIVFAHAPNGRPTGEAFVELANEQALTLAMTRHKEVMGTRYIEVFNSSKMDKLQAQKQLEGFSSPEIDSSSRWASTAMPHSSAHVGHRHLPAAMMQQPAHPMRQQLQPVHMQPYMSADNLANQLAVQCQVAAGRSRMQHVLSPVSSGMGAAAVMPSAVPAAVSTAAYPPPGLQALQQVQASQPGLLQQHAHMLPQISSSAQGMGAPMAAACAGLSQASMQLVQLMPASGMQGMVPAKLNVLQDDGLAGPPACGYQPAQHIKNPLLLQNQVLPPNGYHNLPGMTSVGDLEGAKQLQQLPFTSGSMSALPGMTQGAPAAAHMQQLARLPAAQQMLQQGWGAPGLQATPQDGGMGWQQAHLPPY